ncbi:MAG: hypothetical protein FGM44_04975 [Limnohabitans sp.]|nr:hypothetical protein [Limnohabitans sp.]
MYGSHAPPHAPGPLHKRRAGRAPLGMPLTPHTFPSAPVLPYDAAFRSQLRTGDLLLCSGRGVFSELIQQATDSLWSHVALIVRLDELDRVMLFESLETYGVRTVPLSRYLQDEDPQGHPYPGGLVVVRHRTLARECSPQALRRMLQFAVDQFGRAYNRQEIVRIAARLLAGALHPGRRELKAPGQREYLCSEYVAACLAQAGVPLMQGTRGYVTPADFADPGLTELIGVLKPLL